MPTVKASVPHNLGVDEAKKRISNLAADSQTRFANMVTDVQQTWTGDTNRFRFRAMGMTISGAMHVRANSVDVEVDLPFAALPFKSRIEQQLVSQARHLLT